MIISLQSLAFEFYLQASLTPGETYYEIFSTKFSSILRYVTIDEDEAPASLNKDLECDFKVAKGNAKTIRKGDGALKNIVMKVNCMLLIIINFHTF